MNFIPTKCPFQCACRAALILLVGLLSDLDGAEPQTGPATEQRFPPLVVPEGFKATLFACDPFMEYPSVIALGPRAGTLFVAQDYMTGLGTEIVRRDEVRLLSDTDGDGYADKSVVYAGGFNSIQGLAYHAGTVYAMHAPLLTALKDTNGDGLADERRDLLTGLGLLPEKNPTRLHCANGVTVGHDGWLYLSMGDNGTDVSRPEGDRFVLNEGGILRCRPDGHDLHAFATGLRNIYDVAFDEHMNIFVRDNENDGGDYLLRIYHCFHGSDHGYPYHYYERPDEAVTPLAILGRGSSAGGVCYLEDSFPPEMRGNLFNCEWGRAVVRSERQPSGASFAPMKETDFAAGAATDPYGFKPTDVIVDRDGSLLISDWCDGQRPKRGRGRIYRVSYVGKGATPAPATPSADLATTESLISRLDSPSYSLRAESQTALERQGGPALAAVRQAIRDQKLGMLGRLHAIWILASVGGKDSIEDLFAMAKSDPEAAVRAQAVRAIGDLTDPRFIEHRLETGPGDAAIALRLAAVGRNADPKVVLDVVTALGRLKWVDSPLWLRDTLKQPDSALAHAAMQTLRRCGNWPAVLRLLDEPDSVPVRQIALRAIAEQAEPVVVAGLIDRLQGEPNSARRQQYADALTRVHHKAGPWVYWGYRPAPRTPNSLDWELTGDISKSLDGALADSDFKVRGAILKRMQREQIPVNLASLNNWLREERVPEHVSAILDSLAKDQAPEVRGMFERVILEPSFSSLNRLRSLAAWIGRLDTASEPRLIEIASKIEDGVVLAELFQELGKRPKIDSRKLLLQKLDSAEAPVRTAAIAALAELKSDAAVPRVPALFKDPDVRVRRAAAAAAGRLSIKDAAESLLVLANDVDPETRGASLNSLRQLKVPSAVSAAVEALNQPLAQAAAIEYLTEFGGPDQTASLLAAASSSRAIETLTSVIRAFANWEGREGTTAAQLGELHSAVAKVQGDSGALLRWYAAGPIATVDVGQTRDKVQSPSLPLPALANGWRTVLASGTDLRVEVGKSSGKEAEGVWLAVTDLLVAEPTGAQFQGASSGTLQVWLNGKSAFERAQSGPLRADSDRFEVQLEKGLNRIVVQMTTKEAAAQIQLRFRRRGSSAEHERLAQFALQDSGSVDRGRELFLNVEKSLCMKCHRLQDQGGQIGPDLTGIGSRFARIHVIESILEPSRTIAPSYETFTVALASGRVVTGVKVSENETMLTLGDDQGKTHEIPKTEIDERIKQPRSTMPDGLEKRISDREFLDLITFLISQKKPETR